MYFRVNLYVDPKYICRVKALPALPYPNFCICLDCEPLAFKLGSGMLLHSCRSCRLLYNCSYSLLLDIFSLGVLGIQIITRLFPNPGPCTEMVRDPRFPTRKSRKPVLETERRKSHIDLIVRTHPLLEIGAGSK